MAGKGSGWKGESRRHSLARRGIKTARGKSFEDWEQEQNYDACKICRNIRFLNPEGICYHCEYKGLTANGYEGYENIIHSQEYEGLDGFYHLIVFKDGSYRLETPSGLEFGKFDQAGYSYRAKFQESDIEDWINSVGTDLVNNEGYKFKASGKSKFTIIRDLMRKEGIEDDMASPNFVKDFADNRGIKLTAEEVVNISNKYSLGKPKADEGQIVKYEGELYKVQSIGHVSQPEMLIGGEGKDAGYIYWLEPLNPDAEEMDGWVSEKSIKVVK